VSLNQPDDSPQTAVEPSTAYPIQLDLRGKPVLVVGAGPVGAHKVKGLLSAGARVTVISPEAVPAIAEAHTAGNLRWHQRRYRDGEVADYRLGITCTNDPQTNNSVFADGERFGVWVNSADDVDNCSFTLPAVARSGPVTVAIATQGQSPALAAWLRREAESDFLPGVADLCELMSSARAELLAHQGNSTNKGWSSALADGLLQLVRDGDVDQARELLESHLNLNDDPAEGHR